MNNKRCYRELSKSNFRDNLKGLKNILPEQTNNYWHHKGGLLWSWSL